MIMVRRLSQQEPRRLLRARGWNTNLRTHLSLKLGMALEVITNDYGDAIVTSEPWHLIEGPGLEHRSGDSPKPQARNK